MVRSVKIFFELYETSIVELTQISKTVTVRIVDRKTLILRSVYHSDIASAKKLWCLVDFWGSVSATDDFPFTKTVLGW